MNELKNGLQVKISFTPLDVEGWVGSMNKYCGKIATITQVRNNGWVSLDIDNGAWGWCLNLGYFTLLNYEPMYELWD